MATTVRKAVSKSKTLSGHTPVANLAEFDPDFPETKKSISTASSSKAEKGLVGADDDGVEAVKGAKPARAGGSAEGAIVAEAAPDITGLHDIAEASYGPRISSAESGRAETVLGADDRIRITNTGDLPWRMNASLVITARDGSSWIGTGWFISPKVLITAGHCVFIKNSGVAGRDGWVQKITVIPGRNGTTMPYGQAASTSFRSVTNWTGSGDPNYDYGAIILNTPLGNQTGWYGFGNYSDADLVDKSANISGYPGDKPSGTQWYHAGKITAVNSKKVYYTTDTAGGQSGSAVYRIINGGRYAVAIHAYGSGGGPTNSGTRIVKPVYDNLVAWKAL